MMTSLSKLKDLTPDLYMLYKRRRFSEPHIAGMYDVSRETLFLWRKANNITIDPDMSKWENYEKVFPDEVKRLKRKYLKYHDKAWNVRAIADAMGFTVWQAGTFRRKYFPELLNTKRYYYTAEEKAEMKKNDLSPVVVKARRAIGWPMEKAVSEPIKVQIYNKNEIRRMKKAGMTKDRASARIAAGWDRKRATSEPVRGIHFTPEELKEMDRLGVPERIARERIGHGWERERAMTQPPRIMRKRAKK